MMLERPFSPSGRWTLESFHVIATSYTHIRDWKCFAEAEGKCAVHFVHITIHFNL